MYLIVGVVLVLVVLAQGGVRLAPTDAGRWHVAVDAQADADKTGGAVRVRAADPDAMARIDAAAIALARTRVIAGSVSDGHITYETRSALWGFPDYTTVQYSDGTLRMYARLRFGRSDLGVNARRLDALLAALDG